MILTNLMYHHLLFIPLLQNSSNNLLVLLLGGVCAFLLAYLLTFAVLAFCRRFGLYERAEAGRQRIHKDAIPRLGGIGIFLAFVLSSLLFYAHDPAVPHDEVIRYWLFLGGATLIFLVHVYDDIKGLSPRLKLIAQTITVIIILGPFVDMMFHGVFLFGFSNPFGVAVPRAGLPWYREPIITLIIKHPVISWLSIPAIALTWFWMVGMMNTVNLIDGLDGLAPGVVAITGLFITLISWRQGQDSIAILSAIFTGAVLGFLPHNWNPAKIIMGDCGAMFVGLGLAVLSIMGGAKVALALMVLGIPILDLAIVAINRIRRGQSPVHYDTTHLHYRLRATGLSARQICYVFYSLTLVFGVLALSMARIYKFIGIGLVGVAMIVLIVWIDYRQRQRGVPITPSDPAPGAPDGGENSGERPSIPDAGAGNGTPAGRRAGEKAARTS
jgi:UDP-GlcNAc:undecaprenyl-phosphate GlcNAc-1-phosphate transferase